MKKTVNELVAAMFKGEERALGRLISLVEKGDVELSELVGKAISPYTGKAHRIGITGAAGTGKSTLANRLTTILRQNDLSVGIIAVDPSSHVTGGAVLGDRIRMQGHDLDQHVFIRSMASRGCHGGLSGAVSGAVNLIDAFGKDVILIETTGVGQSEVDVAKIVQTVVLVLVPESGDNIQFMKSGIMEIADIIVINKGDREGCEVLAAELEGILALNPRSPVPSVLITEALHGIGMEELHMELEVRRKLQAQ
jgi:LAO/AO transport system kinase